MSLARHAFNSPLKIAYLRRFKRLLPITPRAFAALHILTLAFLTILPFWRHAGVGATDLAYVLIHPSPIEILSGAFHVDRQRSA
ncbi:hypothetical protein B0G76_6188 [Paraburkholderia sp. BL23I1N1]|nr:hypothetical protein B0G76_6188 [Paraburkholderia sp. BL23I1N1]